MVTLGLVALARPVLAPGPLPVDQGAGSRTALGGRGRLHPRSAHGSTGLTGDRFGVGVSGGDGVVGPVSECPLVLGLKRNTQKEKTEIPRKAGTGGRVSPGGR